MKRCQQCNAKINRRTKFCPECGTEIPLEASIEGDGRRLISRVLIIVLSVLLLISLITIMLLIFGGYNGGDNGVANEDTTNNDFSYAGSFSDDPDMISEAAKSVVKINCYNSGTLVATGSGFAAFQEGVIVTNYHVIETFPERIELETEAGEKVNIFGGIGVSKERDIAILYYQHRNSKINLPLLTVGSSDELKKGEKVVAIGSPLGLKNVVSSGVFSSYANIGDATDIQFTASISDGSSGGALFNDNGEVIGITYASLESGQNLNFAVPIEFVKSLWKNENTSKSELSCFYDSITPHYTVNDVLKHYKELQNSRFFLDFSTLDYIEESDKLVVTFKDDSFHSLKGVCYRNNSFTKRMINLVRNNKKGVECKGTGWLESEGKPYVIIAW